MIFPEDIAIWFPVQTASPDTDTDGHPQRRITEAAHLLAQAIVHHTPDSHDQFWAVHKVREAVMLAHAAIACRAQQGRPQAVAS